jgi:hypothetical protein
VAFDLTIFEQKKWFHRNRLLLKQGLKGINDYLTIRRAVSVVTTSKFMEIFVLLPPLSTTSVRHASPVSLIQDRHASPVSLIEERHASRASLIPVRKAWFNRSVESSECPISEINTGEAI